MARKYTEWVSRKGLALQITFAVEQHPQLVGRTLLTRPKQGASLVTANLDNYLAGTTS